LFSNRIDDLFGRLNDLGGDVRNEINRIALEAFFTNENNIFFGFGIGNTETEKFLEITKYNNFRVHNSFIAVLVEQGIIGLLLIIFILSVLCYKILKSNNNLKIFRLGIFFTMLINLYSIYCFSFLGFWVMFFFLLNPWDDLKNNNL
jgi:O-antigen ligase